jgi:RecA-family ATPase
MTKNNDSIDDAALKRLDLRNAFTTQPPPLDFVLPGMIAGTVGALVAQGGAGKSWIALELAMAVAGGPDLLEIGIDATGSVLYLPAEDPEMALRHRLFAAAPQFDDAAREQLSEALEIVPLMGLAVDLMTPSWAAAVERMAEGKRLVVIDTLRRFHSGDENSAGDMAKLLGVMERLCASTGASMLFLHHTAKGAALNGSGDQQQASRGSSVLVDNVRGGQFNLSGMTEAEARGHGIDPNDRRQFVRLVQAKANFGAPIPDMWFRRADGGILLPAGIERMNNGERGQKATTTAQQRGGRSGV